MKTVLPLKLEGADTLNYSAVIDHESARRPRFRPFGRPDRSVQVHLTRSEGGNEKASHHAEASVEILFEVRGSRASSDSSSLKAPCSTLTGCRVRYRNRTAPDARLIQTHGKSVRQSSGGSAVNVWRCTMKASMRQCVEIPVKNLFAGPEHHGGAGLDVLQCFAEVSQPMGRPHDVGVRDESHNTR